MMRMFFLFFTGNGLLCKYFLVAFSEVIFPISSASFSMIMASFSAIILNKQECFSFLWKVLGQDKVHPFPGYKMTEINILHHFVETRVLNVSTSYSKINPRSGVLCLIRISRETMEIPHGPSLGRSCNNSYIISKESREWIKLAMNIDLREVSVDEKTSFCSSTNVLSQYRSIPISPIATRIFFFSNQLSTIFISSFSFLFWNRDAKPIMVQTIWNCFPPKPFHQLSLNQYWQIKCPTSSCIASGSGRFSRSESNSSAYRWWMWVSVNDIIWNSRKDQRFLALFFTNFAVFVANNSHCLNSYRTLFRQLVTLSHHTGSSLPQNRCRGEVHFLTKRSIHRWLIIHIW